MLSLNKLLLPNQGFGLVQYLSQTLHVSCAILRSLASSLGKTLSRPKPMEKILFTLSGESETTVRLTQSLSGRRERVFTKIMWQPALICYKRA
jgi:hypothetical protein